MRQIKTTPEQEKAMSYIALDPQEWIQNAWDNRARQAMDEIVETYTDRLARKVSVAEKKQIVKDTKIETAKERNTRAEKELFSKT